MKHNWRYEVAVGKNAQLVVGNTVSLGQALSAVIEAVSADPFREHYDSEEGSPDVAHPGYAITIAPLFVSIADPSQN